MSSSVSIMIVVDPAEFAAVEQQLADYEAAVGDVSRAYLPDAQVGVVLTTSVSATVSEATVA